MVSQEVAALSSRSKLAFLCALLWVGLLSTSFVFAQSSSDPSQQRVVFKSRSELVTVPVIVTNKYGGHVHSLKKEDFELSQDGAPQKIATFEEITKPSDPHIASTPTSDRFTNVVTSDAKPLNLTVLVVDLLNTPTADQVNARSALTKYLAELGSNPPPTSIFALTSGGLKVIHDFATDPSKLATAMEKTSLQREGVELATKFASTDQDVTLLRNQVVLRLQEAETQRETIERRASVMTTLQAMRQVAQACAGLPGRKAMLWASGGFPFSLNDLSDEVKQTGPNDASYTDVSIYYKDTWKALNQAQVAVYPVDVRGLVTNLPDPSMGNPGAGYYTHAQWTNSETIGTFRLFAQMTGGLAFYNTNGLKTAFEKAADDNSEYYILSYYLDRQKTKTGWHKLSVRVKANEIQVRTRNGFFVSPTNPDQNNDAEMKVALGSPLNYTAVPIVGRWQQIVPGPSTEKNKKMALFLLTMPANFAEIDESDNNHMKWDFAAVAVTATGVSAGGTVKTFDGHLNGEDLRHIRTNGIDYHGGIIVPPGEYTVRFAVRDRLSGRMGSVPRH